MNDSHDVTVTEDRMEQLSREIRAYEVQLESFRRADTEKTAHNSKVVGVMMPPGTVNTVSECYLS